MRRFVRRWARRLLLPFFLASCQGGVPTPQTVTTITEGVDFSLCVLGQYAQCSSARLPWPQCSIQILQACGGDLAQIARIVDAHRGAEIREGFVPAADGGP